MKTTLFLSGLILSLVLVSSSPVFGAETSGPLVFSDVSSTQEYSTAIETLSELGVVSGYEDGSFQPLQTVTRAEALKMILEVTGKDESTAGTDVAPFEDLDIEAWYIPYVNFAFQEGLVNGDGDALTMRPEDPINAMEAIKILVLASEKSSELPDIENDTWYSAYLAYAEQNALLVSEADGSYAVEKSLTRGELCELLYRFLNHPYTGQVEYGDATYYGYSSNGVNTASGTALDAYGYMAAHKTLPFGTRVKVTNVSTHSSVIVTIVDRGPYGPGRILDLTPAAFEALGSLSTGVLDVRLEVLKD